MVYTNMSYKLLHKVLKDNKITAQRVRAIKGDKDKGTTVYEVFVEPKALMDICIGFIATQTNLQKTLGMTIEDVNFFVNTKGKREVVLTFVATIVSLPQITKAIKEYNQHVDARAKATGISSGLEIRGGANKPPKAHRLFGMD